MIIVGPLGPSARALPWSFVVPGACAVAAFVRPRFGTAPVEWDLAIVDPLLVTRLGAKSLLGSAGRRVVAPYAVGKRCHIGRGQPHQYEEHPRHDAERSTQHHPRQLGIGGPFQEVRRPDACELPAPPTPDLVGDEAGLHGWTGPNADYRLTGVKRDQAPTPPLPAAACPGAFRARTPGPTYSSVSTSP
jgi:hypothetical protein